MYQPLQTEIQPRCEMCAQSILRKDWMMLPKPKKCVECNEIFCMFCITPHEKQHKLQSISSKILSKEFSSLVKNNSTLTGEEKQSDDKRSTEIQGEDKQFDNTEILTDSKKRKREDLESNGNFLV